MVEGAATKDFEYTLINAAGEKLPPGDNFDGYGKATIVYNEGDHAGKTESYVGVYSNTLRFKHGTYKYFNGDVYTGNWQSGNKSGIGQLVYAEAAGEGEGAEEPTVSRKGKYVGCYGTSSELGRASRHGDGTFMYANGDTYSGQWSQGKKHGTGTYCFKEDQTRLTGTWNSGKLVTGKWVFPNGTYYIGRFENGKPNGEGNWVFTNGAQISGYYTQKPKGEGEGEGEGEGAPKEVDAEWKSTGVVSVYG